MRAGDLRFLAPLHFEFWYKKVFGKPRRQALIIGSGDRGRGRENAGRSLSRAGLMSFHVLDKSAQTGQIVVAASGQRTRKWNRPLWKWGHDGSCEMTHQMVVGARQQI